MDKKKKRVFDVPCEFCGEIMEGVSKYKKYCKPCKELRKMLVYERTKMISQLETRRRWFELQRTFAAIGWDSLKMGIDDMAYRCRKLVTEIEQMSLKEFRDKLESLSKPPNAYLCELLEPVDMGKFKIGVKNFDEFIPFYHDKKIGAFIIITREILENFVIGFRTKIDLVFQQPFLFDLGSEIKPKLHGIPIFTYKYFWNKNIDYHDDITRVKKEVYKQLEDNDILIASNEIDEKL